MKENAKASPFAALSPQEQKEQWIWWQCQRPARQRQADLAAEETPAPASAASAPAPAPHHGQYRAVLRKMQEAGKHTLAYQTWPG